MKIIITGWLPIQQRFVAVTWPPFGVFVRREWWEAASEAQRASLLLHESVHWEQYERYGLFGFYWRYIIWRIRYGYEDHPMEIEARERMA